MNVLFVCTSNKDRSPALEGYFTQAYPENNNYRSAGVNKYFTEKHGTHYITQADIDWADFIVFAETVHSNIADRLFGYITKKKMALNIGEFLPEKPQEYLNYADDLFHKYKP